jgi:hypothetical protein
MGVRPCPVKDPRTGIAMTSPTASESRRHEASVSVGPSGRWAVDRKTTGHRRCVTQGKGSTWAGMAYGHPDFDMERTPRFTLGVQGRIRVGSGSGQGRVRVAPDMPGHLPSHIVGGVRETPLVTDLKEVRQTRTTSTLWTFRCHSSRVSTRDWGAQYSPSRWFAALSAPSKPLIEFGRSGAHPHLDEPGRFAKFMSGAVVTRPTPKPSERGGRAPLQL